MHLTGDLIITYVTDPDKIQHYLIWVTLKTLPIHVNVCETVQLLVRFLQYNGEKLKEAEDFKCFLSFSVCSNRNRSAQVCELFH